jgi:hypothetical protein
VKYGIFGRAGHETLKQKTRRSWPKKWDGKDDVDMALGETVPDGSVSQRCRLVAFRFGSIKGDSLIRVRDTLNEFYIRDTLKFAIFEITFHLHFISF